MIYFISHVGHDLRLNSFVAPRHRKALNISNVDWRFPELKRSTPGPDVEVLCPIISIERAVVDGLADVARLDGNAAVKVGDSTRDF